MTDEQRLVDAAGSAVAVLGDQSAMEREQRARAYLLAARADSTRRAYANDWVHFTDWCASQQNDVGAPLGYLPAAPETVAVYLAEHVAR